MTHLFLSQYHQGMLTNPPNAHLRTEKSRRMGKKKPPPKEDCYTAAEHLWFERTYPIDLQEQLLWRIG